MNPIEDWLTQPDGLVDRLLALREQAGLSGKELAERAGWQPSKVSKLANGKQMPTPADIEAWARACDADSRTTQKLLHLLDEVNTVHRDWRRRMRRGQAAVQTSYNELVANTRVMRYFETVYIPGFLQTPDYTRCVLTEMVELHGLDIDDVDAAVAARMQRQQLIYDTSKQFEFLLAEPVMRWLICPPDVMRGQLDRLQSIIGMPNIRFGILPMGVQLATTPQNSFQLYDDIAITETFIGENIYHGEEAAAYGRAMDQLWEDASESEIARHFIVSALQKIP